MKVINPINNKNIKNNELNVEDCSFNYFISDDLASCIHIIQQSNLNINIIKTLFFSCITQISTTNCGTIYILSSSSSFVIHETLFYSCYGLAGYAIYFNSSPTKSTVELNQTITTKCCGKSHCIYFLYDDLKSSDYNASFCLSISNHVFVSHFDGTAYSSFFNFYRNPTTIEYCVSKPSQNNYLIYSNFIENTYQNIQYGVVTVDYLNTNLNVKHCILMKNKLSLFNAAHGTISVSNITCDKWSVLGNNVYLELIVSNTYISFGPLEISNSLISYQINRQEINNNKTHYSHLTLFSTYLLNS